MRASDDVLPARDAYRLWAPHYATETAISALEDAAVRRVTPPLAGRSVLDVGCGTARRLPHDAALAVGADLVFEMLARAGGPRPLVAADARALPLLNDTFDVVWCRLVLGHVREPGAAYHEMARVAAPGATLIVTDFHSAAHAAGHTRTFRDDRGARHAVEHHDHPADEHIALARAAAWELRHRADITAGPEVRAYYERADALGRYEEQRGLPLVLLLMFERAS